MAGELPTCDVCRQPHPAGACAPAPAMAFIPPARVHTPAPEPVEGEAPTALSPIARPGVELALEGRSVGGYRLTRQLGRGGMAAVYLGEQPGGGRVAIKVMRPVLSHQPALVERFYDEARAAGRIGNDHVVQIYGTGQLPEGLPYLAMELLEGRTLAQRLAEGPVPAARGAAILLQLCDAVGAAHACGVVHRDLKPENVFLVQRGDDPDYVKVVDFGVAKLFGGGGGRTQAGQLLGTPEYMSPEQCAGGAVDARSDVYALGVIGFRMATAKLPFSDSSPLKLMLAHLEQPPPAPRSLNPRVPPELEAALLRALAKDPAARFQTAQELGQALRRAFAPWLGRGATPVPASGDDPEAAELLAPLLGTPAGDPYALLGLAPDAEAALVRRRLRAAESRLAGAEARPLSPGQAGKLAEARERVRQAGEALGEPGRRLAFDAGRGNFAGIARAVAEGYPEAELLALRTRLLAGRPELAGRRAAALERIDAARRVGDLREALAAVEAALGVDPLDLQLHRDREVLLLLLAAGE